MSTSPNLRAAYDAALARHGHRSDAAQLHAIGRLDALTGRLRASATREATGLIGRLLGKVRGEPSHPDAGQGIYLWGGVGRGKTFLMDLFHANVGVPARREHFHRLMKDVHARLRDLRELQDPLDQVAADIAQGARVLCLDELFVSDIADAMLLAGLFKGLRERGVTLVFTSNLPPAELYRDGLQRQRFLPAIALLEQHCEIINVDAGEDYRLRQLEKAPLYLDANAPDVRQQLAARFADLTGDAPAAPGTIRVEGRDIPCVACADEVIWFDFAGLCEGPRSQADYVELACDFHTVLLGDVPRMDATQDNAARRFIALVDEFYDRGVKLLIAAKAPIDNLYVGERLRFEFARTRSRLTEMQTHEYLARPHRP
jgi:cell division protein ZapE